MTERNQRDRKRKAPAGDEIKFDLGVGGLFKGLGDFLDVLSSLADQAENKGAGGDINRTGEIKVEGLGDNARAVYGFSVRTGIGGTPRVESFGNIRPTREGPVVDDVREPMVDTFDEGAEVVVVAELAGVAEGEIQVDVQEDILTLQTTGAYKYAKEVLLSGPVDAAGMSKSYKNGILEIRLPKKA
jgi:HSP20 family protein